MRFVCLFCALRFALLLLLPVLAVISYINKTLIGTGKVPVLQGVVTVFTQCREKVDVVCKSCARPNKNRNFRPRNTPDFQTKSRCRRQSKFRRKFSTGSRRCPTRRAFNARRVKHRMRSRHKAFALILGHSAPESRTPGGCCRTGSRSRRRSSSTQRSSNQHCTESNPKSTRSSRHSSTHRRYGCDSRKRQTHSNR